MSDRYNIKSALKHYRYLEAFIENAVDAMQWYIDDFKISSEVRSITQSRMQTMVYKAHMDKALEMFKELCEQDGTIRQYNLIVRKYIDPAGGSDGRGKPYTNDQLADRFDCELRTIYRDLDKAYQKLSVLFFGINGIQQHKVTLSCQNRVIVPDDIL